MANYDLSDALILATHLLILERVTESPYFWSSRHK